MPPGKTAEELAEDFATFFLEKNQNTRTIENSTA